MRRSLMIGTALLAIAAGVLIGIGAYHAGYSHGVTQAADGGRVIRVIGPGYGPRFGFGFLLFPLFIIGLILVARGLTSRRWSRGGWDRGGPGGFGHGEGRGAMFEDWHRRQHEQGAGDQGSRGQPANA